jgi:hypothetical protein
LLAAVNARPLTTDRTLTRRMLFEDQEKPLLYRFVQHLLAKGRIDALEDPAGGVGPHANLRGPAYYH